MFIRPYERGKRVQAVQPYASAAPRKTTERKRSMIVDDDDDDVDDDGVRGAKRCS